MTPPGLIGLIYNVTNGQTVARHTLKFLQHMLHDFYKMSDHFGTFCIKRLIVQSFQGKIFVRNIFHKTLCLISSLKQCFFAEIDS